ncbi:MAG: hypothetical protein K1X89_19820 [Myxococcaceae bacterium]|nr:hypothetical protein [Myxococcaceae bacterium]
MRSALLIVASLALCLGGCKRHPPSVEYTQAFAKHSALTLREGDRAVLLPEMDEVVALLDKVDPECPDAARAIALKVSIADARTKLAQLPQLAVAAAAPPPPPPGSPFPAGPATGGRGVEAAAPVDAGPPPAHVAVGSIWNDVYQANATCLEQHGSVVLDGALSGSAMGWTVKDYSHCKTALPELVGSLALVRDGKVVALGPLKDLTRKAADGGTP